MCILFEGETLPSLPSADAGMNAGVRETIAALFAKLRREIFKADDITITFRLNVIELLYDKVN